MYLYIYKFFKRFLMFDYLKKKMAEDPENVTGFERFLAGGIAGGVA